MSQKIVFVYNANSGLSSSMLDSAHKIFSPSTYNCNLCDITFGVFKENTVWKKFREETNLEFEFLHKDEFKVSYPESEFFNTSLPIILKDDQGVLKNFIPTEELNQLKKAEDLINLINGKEAKLTL
ncbi:GTPase [Cellulophaga sp. 20_2_10]|uniref:GTPase n=1 Tax=Cellulophaga sp. 20_2_10 TaxID=2942476 RepID=UPI00201ACC4E|nr:GTPase [Cellulophaga sp. 20_2_10]MCL5245875.1 GTPase [Cellulophaga sp. 20_2_10]